MGSLGSSSKKSSPQIIYMPAPVPYVPPASVMPPADPQEEERKARTSSLLQRDRGRFGTVLTSFRGLLAPTENASGRKTLLGE
jgi:hypothetical protein